MRAHSGTGAEASCLTLIRPSALVPPPSAQAAAPDRGHPLHAGPHRLHAAGVPAVLPLQHPQEEGEEQEADSAGPAGGQRGWRGLPTGTAGSGNGGCFKAGRLYSGSPGPTGQMVDSLVSSRKAKCPVLNLL